RNFYIVQPQLWSINMMNATNMVWDNIHVNATSPEAPEGYNYVQNTDGFNTLDTRNVLLTNFVYQGGDDCIAIKPRSYDITIKNVTCISGNGIAIGSLGQYLEDSSVANVWIDNATIIKGGAQDNIGNAAYIKTWVGKLVSGGDRDYESDFLPRGGGWGSVTNMLFSNFHVYGASAGGVVSQDSGDNGTAKGTSNMLISNVAFVNFTGYLNDRPTTASVSCSERQPCYNIDYRNYTLYTSNNDTSTGVASCEWTETGGVHGVPCK
ncbi:putative galacturan 1,4-alpha-galacturonidase C, partial [Friedmanniomyces simplex]